MAALYLHVPFCTQRCVYCDFYFVTSTRDVGAYVEALAVEIEAYGRTYGAREPIRTVYLGGGTPSLLPLEAVARLLDAVHRHFDTTTLEELTVEVNPEDATRDYLGGLRALGVTRLSLGVQSFFDEDLRFMGRSHGAAQAERALDAVRAAGFDTYSIDLIFGVPGQPSEHWMANLEKTARLGVPHVSTYGLTVEERTPLGRMVRAGRVAPASDETFRSRFLETMDYLGHHGYEHYEVSSFAQPGARSRHNLTYWLHGNYLGLGPSAHSFWRDSPARATRWSNVRNLRRYLALLGQGHLPIETREPLSFDDLADEAILLRLRLVEDGLDLETLERDYGVDLLTERVAELAELEAAGYVRLRNGVLRLTPEGVLVGDAVAARLV